jgi:fatty acid desaturase
MSAGNSAVSGDLDMGTSALPGRGVLEIGVIRALSRRSDRHGLLRAATHFGMLFVTGTLVWLAAPVSWLWYPALLLHGFVIVTLFAPMHECVHRTAFETPSLNAWCGWVAGVISFYNFTFYRYYHTWHHRYTQDPHRDPELLDPKAASLAGYLAEISGLWFWPQRPWNFLKLALGRTSHIPFIPESARGKIALSAAVQLGIYVAAVASIIAGFPYCWEYWFLPALLAQPLLRAITIAEHTGCTVDDNGLTNTRTTRASWPVRLFMWNMPYHTEHHLYPSIPFYQLPQAHREIQSRLANLANGYVDANLAVIRSFQATPAATPEAAPSPQPVSSNSSPDNNTTP